MVSLILNRPSLRRPANTLYRHNLTATLETAIRCSNAQHDPQDVLRRLDARMLEYSHGEIGWDVFTLEYKIDAPLDTVVDPESMVKYLQLFSHLWQMKRVEGILSIGWMRASKDVESFLRIAGTPRRFTLSLCPQVNSGRPRARMASNKTRISRNATFCSSNAGLLATRSH